MASLFVDIHPSKLKLTLFRDGHSISIASTVSTCFLWQMLLRVVGDGSTRSSRNAVYECHSSRFDIVFHGMWAETSPNIRFWLHVSSWHSKVSQFLAASLECFVCHFGQYRITWMSNMISLCELTIVIPQLPGVFRMGKAVSSTIEVVNSVTSDSVNSFHFVMWAYASKCFVIELVPCSDGWRRTWWQTIHMMPGLPVSSIPQCKWNRHVGTCLEIYQAIGFFETTFIEVHLALRMICNVRLLKSRMKTRSFLEEIITSSKEVFKDFESDMAISIRKRGIPTWKTAESNVTV